MMTTVPQGFYITAHEMREAGIGVHEAIADHTRYVPPSFEALEERINIAKGWRETHEIDGKCAEQDGDAYLVEACRRVCSEVDVVLTTWRNRWRETSHA